MREPAPTPVPNALLCTPIAPKILPQIEYEIFCSDYFTAFDAYHSHTAVLAFSTFSVNKLDIPVYGRFVVTEKIEDVGDTETLDVKMDARILPKEVAEPVLYGAFTLKSAAFRYLSGGYLLNIFVSRFYCFA